MNDTDLLALIAENNRLTVEATCLQREIDSARSGMTIIGIRPKLEVIESRKEVVRQRLMERR